MEVFKEPIILTVAVANIQPSLFFLSVQVLVNSNGPPFGVDIF